MNIFGVKFRVNTQPGRRHECAGGDALSELRHQARRGRIAAGMDADLVVLDADPARHARNFAKVRYTIRAGRVIFSP